MERNDRIIESTMELNQSIIESVSKLIEKVDEYNVRMYRLLLIGVVCTTIMICTIISCYFKASYGEYYNQEINQIIEQRTYHTEGENK